MNSLIIVSYYISFYIVSTLFYTLLLHKPSKMFSFQLKRYKIKNLTIFVMMLQHCYTFIVRCYTVANISINTIWEVICRDIRVVEVWDTCTLHLRLWFTSSGVSKNLQLSWIVVNFIKQKIIFIWKFHLEKCCSWYQWTVFVYNFIHFYFYKLKTSLLNRSLCFYCNFNAKMQTAFISNTFFFEKFLNKHNKFIFARYKHFLYIFQ